MLNRQLLLARTMLVWASLFCESGTDDSSERLIKVGETCSKTGDCDSGLVCVGAVCQKEGAVCPDDKECSGLECGPDPVCGTSSGTCSGGGSCSDGACVACSPSCSGKDCGDYGCGGTCGDCGGGTWTDSTSGNTWQNPAVADQLTWSEAKHYCADLDLDGHKDWRLPTIGELRSLIRGCAATVSGGSCNIEEEDCLAWSCRDDSCTAREQGSGPADGCYWPDEIQGQCTWYWSFSPVEGSNGSAWGIAFGPGGVGYGDIHYYSHFRCVR